MDARVTSKTRWQGNMCVCLVSKLHSHAAHIHTVHTQAFVSLCPETTALLHLELNDNLCVLYSPSAECSIAFRTFRDLGMDQMNNPFRRLNMAEVCHIWRLIDLRDALNLTATSTTVYDRCIILHPGNPHRLMRMVQPKVEVESDDEDEPYEESYVSSDPEAFEVPLSDYHATFPDSPYDNDLFCSDAEHMCIITYLSHVV